MCVVDLGGGDLHKQTQRERPLFQLPSKYQFQCMKGTKQESVQGEEMGFGEENNAQHAQSRCRGVGRDMVQVGSKFGATRQPVSQA
jgi:hypothetical protein